MFVEENIDGKLFLTLPDNPDLLKDLNLSAGGKAKMKEIIRVSSFIRLITNLKVVHLSVHLSGSSLDVRQHQHKMLFLTNSSLILAH